MAVNLFFIPHQDDESLTFGAAIRNHMDVRDDCHVILYTDGRTSSMRKVLNGEEKCYLHRKMHRPSEEGYACVEETDLIRFRNGEFMRACRALGVPADHIHFSSRMMQDGATTVEGCEAVILEFLERFPGARVKTFTDLGDNHRDHANMGRAGRSLLKRGVISDLRLYIEPYNLRKARKSDRSATIHEEHSAVNKQKVVDALNEYKKYNPNMEEFSIGYHSVKKFIDAAIAKPVSYYHKP